MVWCGNIVRFYPCRRGEVWAHPQGAGLRTLTRAVILAAITVALSLLAAAQSTTSLRGVITDAKGGLLPGATVKLSDPKTGFARTVTSGDDGVYLFLQVPPSTYNLEITASGFAAAKRQNVTLLVSTPATLNITLQVQGAREHVDVTSGGPAGKHAGRLDWQCLYGAPAAAAAVGRTRSRVHSEFAARRYIHRHRQAGRPDQRQPRRLGQWRAQRPDQHHPRRP